MFGLGFSELLFLGLLALILIGPEELTEVARTLGRLLNELKRGSDSFKDEFRQSTRKIQDELKIEPPKLDLPKFPLDAPAAKTNVAENPPVVKDEKKHE